MKKIFLILPLLGIVGCASMPKNVEVYMRSDVDTSKSKIIAFPLLLTDGKTLKAENTSFSVPVVDAFVVKEWSSYIGGGNTIAVPKLALDKIPGAYNALNHVINALDSISAVEQSTELTKLLEGINSQFGDGAFGFALVFENKQEYNATKQLHLNMGIFDIKKLTWKWITKATHQKVLVPVPYEVAVQKLIKDSMTMIGGKSGATGKKESRRRAGFAAGNNVLEVVLGAHGAPSGPNYSSLAEYKSRYHAGVNYIYNFTPSFGLGAGYARFNTDSESSFGFANSSNISQWNEKASDKVDTYKLLCRFTFLPEKRWNPELTVGLGGFSLKESIDSHWTGSHYDSLSSSWVQDPPQNWAFDSNVSGVTGSVGIGVRYFLTKHLSAGIKGEYEYYRGQSTVGYNWYWYQMGGVVGLKF